MATELQIQLPEKVDEQLRAICVDKSVASADAAARKLLLEVGEQESLKILKTIRNSAKVTRLSGFITYLVKKLRNCPSPHTAPLTNSPQGNSSNDNKRKRSSDFSVDVLTARRQCDFGSPTKIIVKSGPLKSDSDRVLDELEKLEFRKAFLILNYIGCCKLEDVVSAERIRSYQGLAMSAFEIQIWNDFGRANCLENERVKVLNWETGERYLYHCHADAEGHHRFKGPYFSKAATHLQKTVGDEHVLIVKFMEQEKASVGAKSFMHSSVFNKVFEEGIFVGRRRYRFFVFKDGGKEEKRKDPVSSPVKCYFICTEGFASILGMDPHLLKDMPIEEARSIFMHIHNASNPSIYMARFSLLLSKTITLDMNFNDVHVEILEDIPCLNEDGSIIKDSDGKALILTDGTGFISENLALRCPHNCYNGYVNDEENIQGSAEAFWCTNNFSELSDLKSLPGVAPLLIQFRMFHKGRAIKGTVLVNKKLPPNTIQVRRSMVKIDIDENLADAVTVNSFEVVATSNKPKVACLSKNLIALLHYGGVPRTFFMSMLSDALKRPLSVLYRTKAALKVAVNWDYSDELIAAKMVGSGIPLDEPFLQRRLLHIVKEEMKSPKGGKLPVSDCFYVMGTADPTGTLNSNEVCVILDQGPVSGPVLVYRNPGIHPGDIHVVNARYVEALKDIVGNSKYGIFFPSKGPRSMADEIAGGDYDGDMYWVSTNSELLKHFRPSEPWRSPNSQKPNKKQGLSSGIALERDLFRLYLDNRFHSSNAMGIAADSWLMYMDRMLTLKDECAAEKATLRKKINELIDIYYDALDAPKKGRRVEVPPRLIPSNYPHHMGRGEHCTYHSTSILGQIYDTVDRLTYPIKIWKLECFQVEIPEVYRASWSAHYFNYRIEMRNAIGESRNTNAVYQKYRKELYGGVDDLDLSKKSWEMIQLEAMAIYHVCYDYADSVGDPEKCGFAWKVAGDSLWKIFLLSKGEKPMWFASSVVRKMMR